MAKIKITTLTDKMKDEEILSKLKSIGVKVKDKEKGSEEHPQDGTRETTNATGETIIEKRVASTIIRRRVAPPPPPPPPEEPETKVEEAPVVTEKPAKKQTKEPQVKMGPVIELVRQEPVEGAAQEAPATEGTPVDEAAPAEEPVKAEVEAIGEEKKQEITRQMEEVYKQDLEKNVLVEEEDDEDKKKKKAERLLKKIEEEDVDAKGKKKGALKRKVIIKEEDLYAFRRPRGRALPFRRRGARSEQREEDKKPEAKAARKVVKVPESIQVIELAKRLSVKAQEIVVKLIRLGVMANVNQSIDYETASLVSHDLGFDVERVMSIEEDFLARETEENESDENLKFRPPVVTIMGHVDHGKTLLLDTIRNTNVAEREAGGITQHIGAYITHVNGKQISFVDTPGHAAFTAMRARGALVTDIVVLVVAADDGVMPQTIEAINHAKAANVPIIVAINKIDKQNANPDKVIKGLTEYGLVPEEWGGSTLMAKISAKKKIGIEELLELILLQSEMLELRANPDRLARGIIIESGLDKGHGPVGTVIIQEGTLKVHDPFVAGTSFGRVRAMVDDHGKRIQQAPPSTPVLVVGFSDVPQAGNPFVVTTEESYARELSRFRQEQARAKDMTRTSRITLDELYAKMKESDKLTLNVVLKGDARGTLDAIGGALIKLSTGQVQIQIIHNGAGSITETDLNLAMASGAIIIGFNVKPMPKVAQLAEQEHIDIRTYSVIYDMIDDVRMAMEGMLAPKIVETRIGKAEVRKVFSASKIGLIAGSYVSEGKVTRSATAKVLRKGAIIFTGKISSLKRFKDDAKEVQSGYECGIALEGFSDIVEGDIVEFFIEEEQKQTLNDA